MLNNHLLKKLSALPITTSLTLKIIRKTSVITVSNICGSNAKTDLTVAAVSSPSHFKNN